MKFLPGRHALESVVQPEAFEAPIEVKGLSAGVLEGLFHGAADARRHWSPGLSVSAALTGRDLPGASAGAKALSRQDLADGLVELESGAAGKVEVRTGDTMGEYLLPQSLGLLLAQQWSRAELLMVHAAAFRIDGRGILALGDQGAGKSVLTASALIAGARVVSDDWVMVGPTSAGVFDAERIREFLMLRNGRACDRILAELPGISARGHGARAKAVIRFAEQPHDIQRNFARHCAIDEIWLVKRPEAGHAGVSRIENASPSRALAAIVQASMPILFSGRFPVESARIRRATARLIDQSRCRIFTPGTDLIDDAGAALAQILGPRPNNNRLF